VVSQRWIAIVRGAHIEGRAKFHKDGIKADNPFLAFKDQYPLAKFCCIAWDQGFDREYKKWKK
jgi:hypothetical protein